MGEVLNCTFLELSYFNLYLIVLFMDSVTFATQKKYLIVFFRTLRFLDSTFVLKCTFYEPIKNV